jgi:hypothetical protein
MAGRAATQKYLQNRSDEAVIIVFIQTVAGHTPGALHMHPQDINICKLIICALLLGKTRLKGGGYRQDFRQGSEAERLGDVVTRGEASESHMSLQAVSLRNVPAKSRPFSYNHHTTACIPHLDIPRIC